MIIGPAYEHEPQGHCFDQPGEPLPAGEELHWCGALPGHSSLSQASATAPQRKVVDAVSHRPGLPWGGDCHPSAELVERLDHREFRFAPLCCGDIAAARPTGIRHR